METIKIITIEISEVQKIVFDSVRKALKHLLANQDKESHEMLSRIDTAKKLKVSLPTLNSWTKEGIIAGYRIGHRVYYKLEDITKALVKIKTLKYNS